MNDHFRYRLLQTDTDISDFVICTFVHLFVRSFIYSFIQSFIHSFIIHLFVCLRQSLERILSDICDVDEECTCRNCLG